MSVPQGVSVVIVNWNRRELLCRCLGTLAAAAGGEALDVLVADNGSTDGSAEAARAAFPGCRVIELGENRGYAAAANAGLAAATGRHLVLMNNDVRLAPGALAAAAAYLDAHPRAGVVGFRLENPDGTLQPSGRARPTVLGTVLAHWRLGGDAFREDRDYAATVEVDEVSGACMMVRREALAAAGPLDEEFFFYYEDIDWCLRIRAAGFAVVYLPAAVAVHDWGATSAGAGWVRVEGRRSMLRFFGKHAGTAAAWALRAALLPIDLARLARAAVRADRDGVAMAWRMLTGARADTARASRPR